MDALSRADQVLARAQARRAGVVTPDSATSPMDQASTVQIPRTMVTAADPRAADDLDDTVVVSPAVFGRAASAYDDFGPTRRHR